MYGVICIYVYKKNTRNSLLFMHNEAKKTHSHKET